MLILQERASLVVTRGGWAASCFCPALQAAQAVSMSFISDYQVTMHDMGVLYQSVLYVMVEAIAILVLVESRFSKASGHLLVVSPILAPTS